MNNNIITLYLAVYENGSFVKKCSQNVSRHLALAVEFNDDYARRWASVEGYEGRSVMIQR